MPNIFLDGSTTYLRALELEDTDFFWSWFSDREVVKYSLGIWLFPFSKDETHSWLADVIHDKQVLSLGIVEKSTSHLIGYAGITSISKLHRSGEYYLFIGDKNCWGKGYGTEVTRLIVNYGFLSLNLHRIMLTVSEPNIGAVKAYTKAGFRTEGVMRQSCFRDGHYHDKLIMSVLRPEWDELAAPTIMPTQ
jgi:RimJ/RimL family protein N-acetyltransferase